MQPDTHSKSSNSLIGRVAGKEITLFFASPVAYLFLACFAAVSLFVFFWGESFFARNIADVRPLFEWMPLLLIFLCSTLTMRLWSEERRSGTLEHVLTMPAPLWHFVAGKFLACLALLAIALVITLPLPVTVAIIGELDWGPVLAGYLATFLLGAAYLSVGLFVSAQANNQIVSLIVASALCGFFYLLGAPVLTDLFGSSAAEWLRALGTGSRFDAVARGVIDLRDLYYYLSLVAVFLALNTLVLERERWAAGGDGANRSRWRAVTALLVANALGANLWLGQIHSLRLDVTEGRLYSISPATRDYLAQLEEPLLIRGYFSSKTHPLLAPLVPQLRDLLREYEVAGDGRVRVEFVDPAREPEMEEEANQKYGIAPVPFQVADRYQASIVSSYFDVLVQYGDEHQVLGFRDLIEIKAGSETDVDVQLRNPEHDLTRAIRKVLQSYQAGGNLFDTVKGELAFTAYVSADQRLPEQLLDFRQTVRAVAEALQREAGGRLSVEFVDPEANGGAVAKQIAADYGFQPMAAGLFGEPFYFYLTLAKGDQVVQIPLDDLKKESLERNFEAGIKRFASGFTKTVALVAPERDFAHGGFGGGAHFTQLESLLGAELNIEREDLSDGHVSGNADILLLLSPRNLDQKQLYAVDQFLMQGGTVIAATSPYSASLNNRNLSLVPVESGLDKWLEHMGLKIEDKLVLDPQNSAFPVPVTRNIGGFQLQELRMLDYPYFVDLRGDGLNRDNPITANLPQATLSWASPISVYKEKSGERQITELLKSSEGAWLSSTTDVMPRLVDGAVSAFAPDGKRGAQLLGVISAGRFDSYFADKQSPLLAEQLAEKEEGGEEKAEGESAAELESLPAQISRSPESARILLFSSNDFLRDQVLRMSGSAAGSEYLNTLQLLANSVDWALEDAGLLSIRSRSHFNRTLPPMEHGAQLFWEYLNYICALLALGLVALLQQLRKRARQRRYRELLAG